MNYFIMLLRTNWKLKENKASLFKAVSHYIDEITILDEGKSGLKHDDMVIIGNFSNFW